MLLNPQIKCFIKGHSLEFLKEEVCGLIYFDKTNKKVKAYKCENIAKDKINNFSINPKDYLLVSHLGEILGSYHSQVEKDFSEFDKMNSENHKITYFMYSKKEDDFYSYYPKNEINKYIGISFEIGVNDCFSLIRNYFYHELGISIQDYYRDSTWIKNSPELFFNNFEKEGFIGVSNKYQENILQKYDCIFLTYPKVSNFPHHVMLYLGNGTVLHHEMNRLSCVEIYEEMDKKNTSLILRHKDFIYGIN